LHRSSSGRVGEPGPEDAAQPGQPVADVLALVLHQAVGVQHEQAAVLHLELAALHLAVADAERRRGRHVQQLVAAVRVHEQWRQVAGHRYLAYPADRVVDRVGAGGEVRLALAEGAHELVELQQGVGGRQLEHGQGVDRGAQPPHGVGGPHTVPGHVPDHERDPASGQRDGLVPVPADLDHLAAGQVAVPDLDRGGRGEPGRQHAPLQR